MKILDFKYNGKYLSDFGFKVFQGKIKTVQEYIDNLTNKKIIERLYKNEN